MSFMGNQGQVGSNQSFCSWIDRDCSFVSSLNFPLVNKGQISIFESA